MFTPIDKNLLIAAMESAIYHACVNANVISLHAIETGVSSLRQRFDLDADSVSDADIFNIVDTIERAKIPTISTISALDNETNIADRVVSYLWKNILEKPSVFPSDWGMLANTPTTFPPAAHAHAYADITDTPATFPPAEHTHPDAMADWNTLQNKPATFPPAEHTHTDAMADWDTLQNKPATFPPEAHTHPEYVGGSVIADASPTWKLRTGGFWTPSFPFAAEGFERVWMSWKGSIVPDSGAEITLYQDGREEAYEWFRFLCTPTRIFQVVAAGGQYAQTTLDSDAFDMLAEITPTAVNVTVNGATISCPHSAAIVGTESINFSVGGQVFEHLIYWPGDRACVAPRVAYDAAQIDNNILINQAARHIGAGQYDLTLDAPVVLYQ